MISNTVVKAEDADPINVKVITSSLDAPNDQPKVMIINYGDYEHRRWLAKHSWWAFKTNHMISTAATKDVVTFVHRQKEAVNERA